MPRKTPLEPSNQARTRKPRNGTHYPPEVFRDVWRVFSQASGRLRGPIWWARRYLVRRLQASARGKDAPWKASLRGAGIHRNAVRGCAVLRMLLMAHYYSVLIPWSDTPTMWHPSDRTGPFALLSRGAFRTVDAARAWAERELRGEPYRLKRHEAGYPVRG